MGLDVVLIFYLHNSASLIIVFTGKFKASHFAPVDQAESLGMRCLLSQVSLGRMTATAAANVLASRRRQVHRLQRTFKTDCPATIWPKVRGHSANNRTGHGSARETWADTQRARDESTRRRNDGWNSKLAKATKEKRKASQSCDSLGLRPVRHCSPHERQVPLVRAQPRMTRIWISAGWH